jgi:hypothetical protein
MIMSGEAEEKGIVSLRQAAAETEGHVCGVCQGPDSRICGCEAKAAADGHVCPVCNGPDHRDCGCESKKRAAELPILHYCDPNEEPDAEKVLSQLIDCREAQLAAIRDCTEQLKIIAGHLGELAAQKKIVDSVKTGGPHGN